MLLCKRILTTFKSGLKNRGLRISKAKTVCILFKNVIKRSGEVLTLFLDKKIIPQVYKVNFLGVIFDYYLNFKSHIEEV